MSKAFTKEDVEPPERTGRKRDASGLPAGAVNYVTAEGAARLSADKLVGAVIVPTRDAPPTEALFGSTVTVREPDGSQASWKIVGAPEAGLEPHWVSWVSPLGRRLLGRKVGDVLRAAGDLAPAAVVVGIE